MDETTAGNLDFDGGAAGNCMNPGFVCGGLLKCPAARALMVLLVFFSLCVQAWAQSSPLAGRRSGGGDSAIAVEFHLKMLGKKKNSKARLDMNPITFVMAIVPGKPAKLIVPVTNLLDAPITISGVVVEDKSGALTLGRGGLAKMLLAPGEKFEIPVILSTKSGKGNARVRITVASEKVTKQEIDYVDVSYNRTSKPVPPDGQLASGWGCPPAFRNMLSTVYALIC
jgi:hypothetical protein